MKVIVGLGNPGDKYALTRHNMGYEVINYLADKYNVSFKLHLKAHVGIMHENDEKILLVKPQTFMNLSGESVVQIVNYYQIELEDLFIVYDDIDLELGKIRIRQKGSAGTHNGMRSIVNSLHSQDMPRLRLGIGKEDNIPLYNYVLQKFSAEQVPAVKDIVIKASEAVMCFIHQGIKPCMNKYNRSSEINKE